MSSIQYYINRTRFYAQKYLDLNDIKNSNIQTILDESDYNILINNPQYYMLNNMTIVAVVPIGNDTFDYLTGQEINFVENPSNLIEIYTQHLDRFHRVNGSNGRFSDPSDRSYRSTLSNNGTDIRFSDPSNRSHRSTRSDGTGGKFSNSSGRRF